jgi:hypothetical protein
MQTRNISSGGAVRNNGLVFLFALVGWCLYAELSSGIRAAVVVSSFSPPLAGFSASTASRRVHPRGRGSSSTLAAASDNDINGGNDGSGSNDAGASSSSLSNYQDLDGASKGIVGALTGIVNKASAAARASHQRDEAAMPPSSPTSAAAATAPLRSPEELLERLRKDYEERNYLWTGDLDLACFRKDCVFTDPTISFVGTDKFTENTQNLVPLVDAFAEDCRSDLLSISLGGGDGDVYVETHWNMVGALTASPWFFWKPRIDVIGRTKFWFRREGDASAGDGGDRGGTGTGGGGYTVYFYDESWEIAAWQALLQIVTPAGTFPSTTTSAT